MTLVTKIAITGTHSTGKSTFLNQLERRLTSTGYRVATVNNLACSAQSLGFPILRNHTYESTLYIMAEVFRQEAHLSLSNDVILIDRPPTDAFAYLVAALHATDRTLPQSNLTELQCMALNHTRNYDHLLSTSLDDDIPLGNGRDSDLEFRKLVATTIKSQLEEWSLHATNLQSTNKAKVLSELFAAVNTAQPHRRA